MGGLRRICFAAVVVLVAVPAVPARAVVGGQKDTFQDGTRQGWQNGDRNPNPAAVVSTGGPAGAGDAFLNIVSNGAGAGGKLIAFNQAQWTGDYLAAGVDAISMQVNNTGPTDLMLRLMLGRDFVFATSANAVVVPAGGGWTTIVFPLNPASLSGGNYGTIMSGVQEIDLIHSPGLINNRTLAPDVVAQLGVDNITAVPEPGAVVAGAAGCLVLLSRRTKRR